VTLLVLVLPNGGVIRDPEWHTIADVMKGFSGFGVQRVYGQVQTEDGVALTPMVPYATVIEPPAT
jgi:hypothetical protein